MPKFSWVLSNFPLRIASPNQGKALVILLIALSLTIVACSRIPNPFTPMDSGDRILASQRGNTSTIPRTSTATKPTSALLFGTMPGLPETTLGANVTVTATTTAAPVASAAGSGIISPSHTATPTVVTEGILFFSTPSPTKTPTGHIGNGPIVIGDLSAVFASATPTITPTATPVPPTPEVPPTRTPQPVATATAGLPLGSTTATVVSTKTPWPTRTSEPTEVPNYGGGGGNFGGGSVSTPGTTAPTPFGINSATPTMTNGATETPTPGMPPTPTRRPWPTVTAIPEGTYDAIVNILMLPNEFQVETYEEFTLDVYIDPNGQEITVA